MSLPSCSSLNLQIFMSYFMNAISVKFCLNPGCLLLPFGELTWSVDGSKTGSDTRIMKTLAFFFIASSISGVGGISSSTRTLRPSWRSNGRSGKRATETSTRKKRMVIRRRWSVRWVCISFSNYFFEFSAKKGPFLEWVPPPDSLWPREESHATY